MVFIFYSEGGIRKAALSRVPVALCNRRGICRSKWNPTAQISAPVPYGGMAALRNMPVACFNRRGFSAEKESHRPDLSARFIRRDGRLLAECRRHSATAVGARRPTTSKIFNGCLPQKMESHRPDLSARSIRRDGRLLAECRRHSATAVGARRPTTSKIFNGCSPQRKESYRPDLSARSIRRDGRIGAECMRCLRNISAKKIKNFLPADGISRRTAVFHAAKSRRKSAGKCRFSPVLIIIFSV